MLLPLTQEERVRLTKALSESPDAETLSETEYVADFYDLDTPFTIDIIFSKDGKTQVEACAHLLYDEAQDGWYMGERLESADEVRALLTAGGAL